MPRFFTEGKLLSFEQMMSQPPGYSHKGGGKRSGYKYTAEDADCRFCLYYCEIIEGCKVDKCCLQTNKKCGAK